MSPKLSLFAAAIAGFVFFPSVLSASPKMQIDAPVYNAGIAGDDHTSLIRHSFLIKNVGDSTLSITNVRPACGCTTAGYDSVIPPGKTGHVEVEVNSEYFQDGEFVKKVSITSNDDKNSPFNVTVQGIKRKILVADPMSVNFLSGKGRDTGVTVLLKTDRKNFAVTSVNFYVVQDNGNNQNIDAMGWRSSIPMSFTLVKMPDSASEAVSTPKSGAPAELPARVTYKLNVPYTPSRKEPVYGQLIIKTNIQERPELQISASIEAARR